MQEKKQIYFPSKSIGQAHTEWGFNDNLGLSKESLYCKLRLVASCFKYLLQGVQEKIASNVVGESLLACITLVSASATYKCTGSEILTLSVI